MFSRFFIDRPIFASVLSIVITLAGGIAVFTLPIAQFPPVAPPTVQVDCNYPGASAQVVAETVAAPIEQMVNGVQDMMYMSSQSTSDGSYTLTVTFKQGINVDFARVLVQNRVTLAMPSLPDVVRQTGVTTRKRSPDILLTVSLNSPPTPTDPDGRYDQLYLSNFAVMHVKDELSRLPGISEVTVFGQRDYSMRIWLDPDKLAVRSLTVTDVVDAIREQNSQVALGQIGRPPALDGQLVQIPLTTHGRLVEPEEFAAIVIRANADGRMIRIGDVGRVELGAKSEDVSNRFDGKPTVGLAVFQLPDANALATADLVKAKMDELSKDFPEGVVHEVGYDTTPYIRESIQEVFKALRDSIILVAIVVLIFLQGWRAAIIPLIAVPVAIVGTFAAMAVVGFSLNNLTLFGLVLAIGIVVDDAIVVVEAVEHHIEHGLAPRAAAIKAMNEVSGPVIAVGLVLSAVFIPCAFLSGITGQFFRQFALTIAVSTILSTFNSLTLSPALAAALTPAQIGEAGSRDVADGSLSGVAVPRLQCGLSLFDGGLHPIRGQVAADSRTGAGRVRRTPDFDVLGIRTTPDGIYPLAGQGISCREHATARFVLRDPHEGRRGENREDCLGDTRDQEREFRRRQLVHAERLWIELWFHVHHSQRFCRTASPGYDIGCDRRKTPEAAGCGNPGSHRQCLPPSGSLGIGTGRRIQVDGRGPRRRRPEDVADADRQLD